MSYNWVAYFDCDNGHDGGMMDDCPFCRTAELEAKVERLEDPDWLTYIELTKQWLAHYPADIFDGSSGAPGPLFVVAIRNALAVLEGE